MTDSYPASGGYGDDTGNQGDIDAGLRKILEDVALFDDYTQEDDERIELIFWSMLEQAAASDLELPNFLDLVADSVDKNYANIMNTEDFLKKYLPYALLVDCKHAINMGVFETAIEMRNRAIYEIFEDPNLDENAKKAFLDFTNDFLDNPDFQPIANDTLTIVLASEHRKLENDVEEMRKYRFVIEELRSKLVQRLGEHDNIYWLSFSIINIAEDAYKKCRKRIREDISPKNDEDEPSYEESEEDDAIDEHYFDDVIDDESTLEDTISDEEIKELGLELSNLARQVIRAQLGRYITEELQVLSTSKDEESMGGNGHDGQPISLIWYHFKTSLELCIQIQSAGELPSVEEYLLDMCRETALRLYDIDYPLT